MSLPSRCFWVGILDADPETSPRHPERQQEIPAKRTKQPIQNDAQVKASLLAKHMLSCRATEAMGLLGAEGALLQAKTKLYPRMRAERALA